MRSFNSNRPVRPSRQVHPVRLALVVGTLVAIVGAATPGAGAAGQIGAPSGRDAAGTPELVAGVRAALGSSSVRASALTVPSPYGAADATGDADPRADITAYGVYYDPTKVTLAFKTVTMTDPRTAVEWDCTIDADGCGASEILDGIDTNGDGNPDFYLAGFRDPDTGDLAGELTLADDTFTYVCDATFDWNAAAGYTLSYFPGCMGGFGPISVILSIGIDLDPLGASGTFSDDFAPAAHQYTPFVAMGAAPPPPPPPPPPTYPVKAAGFVLDAFGGLHGFRTATSPSTAPVVKGGPYWKGWDIARGVDMFPSLLQAGYIVDGWGGLHPFSSSGSPFVSPPIGGASYWRGWDIVRDVALLRDGTGGFILDGWGGLHGFSIGTNPAPVATGGAYWKGWDIARGVTLLADGTGYVVDGQGGLHPFTTNATVPAATHLGPYWPNLDIAQGVSVLRDGAEGTGGYVLDGFGGLSGFDIGANGVPNVPGRPVNLAYWPGWNIARGVVINSE